jgi:hypothetical protein
MTMPRPTEASNPLRLRIFFSFVVALPKTLPHGGRIRRHSSEQHGKPCARAVGASTDLQFAADLFGKGSNDLHPQSRAGVAGEPFRQSRAIIANRKRVAVLRHWPQPGGDPAPAIFGCIGDQLAGDEAVRNSGGRRQIDSMPSTVICSGDSSEDTIAEKSRTIKTF